MTDHAIEAELLVPPPRPARLPNRYRLLLVMASFLGGVVLLLALQAFVVAGRDIWLLVAGHPITAVIQSVETAPSATGNPASRALIVRYHIVSPGVPRGVAMDGVLRAAESPGMRTEPDSAAVAANRYHAGGRIALRWAPWPGGPYTRAWPSPPYYEILFHGLGGAVIVALLAALAARLGRWRRRRLALLRDGTAVVGSVTALRVEAADPPRYWVEYRYTAEDYPHTAAERCSLDQWRRFRVDQSVTVLHDPATPSTSALYVLIGR